MMMMTRSMPTIPSSIQSEMYEHEYYISISKRKGTTDLERNWMKCNKNIPIWEFVKILYSPCTVHIVYGVCINTGRYRYDKWSQHNNLNIILIISFHWVLSAVWLVSICFSSFFFCNPNVVPSTNKCWNRKMKYVFDMKMNQLFIIFDKFII